ncbi:hypothetical protein [Bradyrhizobium sp. Tv2a-2]|uniref:hypothetical protein n=1 Tax=Bradyrhizobium sp. Tv2a-2 TaxID=113395 RepID=UPI0012EC37A3|nr:hypothetical protein [Bradyrhizobium sp. Tv2a-2]
MRAPYCLIAQSAISIASAEVLAFQAAMGCGAASRRAAIRPGGAGSMMLTPLARIRA